MSKRSSRSHGSRHPARRARIADPAPLSPAGAAGLVGVSESTLKRWVDAGHLLAEKTAGGHRRIAVQDLVTFLRSRGRAAPSPEALGLLGGPRRTGSHAASLSAETLAGLLLGGDVSIARRLLVGAYTGGQSLDRIGDEVLGPAMARIGERWAAGELDVSQEHLATQRLWSILGELRAVLPALGDHAPLAIGAAPEDDPYHLPGLAVELTLTDLGWRVLNLGPDTPMTALAAAVRRHRPRVVWLSITSQRPAQTFRAEYPRLVEATREGRAALIVGGQGLTAALQHQLVAAAFGSRLGHVAELARTLHPRTPARPPDRRQPGSGD